MMHEIKGQRIGKAPVGGRGCGGGGRGRSEEGRYHKWEITVNIIPE